jgi:hypothetical protein
MPLTEKGSKVLSAMKEEYGPEKGESVFYASRNKGTISGVDTMARETSRPFGAEDPVTKGESISGDQEGPQHERPLDPVPETEHPQKDPGESTDPEPATPGGDDAPPAPVAADARPFGAEDPVDCGDQMATAMPSMPPPVGDDIASGFADINGGITGGAIPQTWGTQWRGPTSDALPTECSLADMMRDGDRYWGQWTPRPLGPDQK